MTEPRVSEGERLRRWRLVLGGGDADGTGTSLGDPIERLKQHLIVEGRWSEAKHEKLVADLRAEVQAAWKEAQAFGTMTEGPFLDPATMFDGCDVVVRTEMRVPRVAACPIEARAAASAWRDGRLHHWVSVQAPHAVKMGLQAIFGLDPTMVRVIAPDVGGGFGGKLQVNPEEFITVLAARRTGKPCKYTETRSESLMAGHHGRDQWQRLSLSATKDGTVTGLKVDLLADMGVQPNRLQPELPVADFLQCRDGALEHIVGGQHVMAVAAASASRLPSGWVRWRKSSTASARSPSRAAMQSSCCIH